MEHTVEVKNITRRFGDFTAVDSVSFSVKKGEIFGFLGPNGAGKSTTIKMLCGILKPTEGSGHVHGHDILTGQEAIKESIGYMSQRFSLYEDLTVRENLEFFGAIYGLGGGRLAERTAHAMEIADIGDRGDSVVKTLPAGMKQRLALGAAILHDPPVLFLDEPTSGVDPIMRRNFWEFIYELSRGGKTVFVTTHYMDEAEHCDRIALIIAGKIIALDSPARLRESLGYSVYSLRVERFIEAFETVAAAPFIDEAAIFGSDIHILCGRDIPLKKNLRELLRGAGFGAFHLERIEATLEDVFVTEARKHGV